MTIGEKAKFAAVKRHIKAEYGKAMAEAYRGCDPAECAKNFGKAAAYLDVFKTLFYSDREMTDKMIEQLIKLKDNG